MNQTRTCKKLRYDNSRCNRPLYDDKLCIFHSEEIDKKTEEFNKAFWKEFERQKKEDKCYDFSSFIFPDSKSFDKIEFDKDAYFELAQFTGEKTFFREAKFKGKTTSFMDAKFTGNEISFSGAKFTGNVTDFSLAKFTGNMTSFIGAEFTGNETSFSGAIFTGKKTSFEMTEFTGNETSFSGAKFTGKETYFRCAKFTGEETYFREVEFTGKETSFRGAEFTGEKTYFSGAKLTGKETHFIAAKFTGNETSFEDTQFTGRETSFCQAEFTGKETSFKRAKFIGETTSFHGAKLISETTSFFGAKFTGKVGFSLAIFKNVWGLFESLTKERKWLFLKKYLIKDWRFYLQEETANRHPLIKRMVNDAWYLEEFKLRHPIVYFLWKISSDCGRSILRWAVLSLGIALLFGFLFMRIDPAAFDLRHANTGFSFFYYSVVTFTTLGFGDITPKTLSAEILVTIEVILGYIMLGGLISILANKLARRS